MDTCDLCSEGIDAGDDYLIHHWSDGIETLCIRCIFKRLFGAIRRSENPAQAKVLVVEASGGLLVLPS